MSWATSTAPLAQAATVKRLFSNQARISAVTQPAVAVMMFPVDEKIAGNVMAPSTAYGM